MNPQSLYVLTAAIAAAPRRMLAPPMGVLLVNGDPVPRPPAVSLHPAALARCDKERIEAAKAKRLRKSARKP